MMRSKCVVFYAEKGSSQQTRISRALVERMALWFAKYSH
jgi:hypothetical protein